MEIPVISPDNQILDSPFYSYHKGDQVWLGLITHFGVFYEVFDEIDWRQWLREELSRSHPTEIPQVFLEMR